MPIAHETFRRAAEFVRHWQRPVLLTHQRADGDALGCLVAGRRLLHSLGARPAAFVFEPVHARYQVLVEHEALPVWQPGTPETLHDADGVLILDTCTYNQLEPAAAWLRSAPLPKCVIDHHVTRDPVAEMMLIDETASAASLLLWEWAVTAHWPMATDAATALFAGMATDTGWFRYSNTDTRSLHAASELIRMGVQPHELYRRIYQCESPARLRLQGAVLGSMELHPLSGGGTMALMTITPDVFQATSATPADTEDLVNEPLRMADTVVAVLLVDQGDGIVRASLRSKALPRGSRLPDVDVAMIAAGLGGGGHTRAAGARVPGTLAAVRAAIMRALNEPNPM